MNVYFTTKHRLKTIRWRGRRALAALRWGAEALEKAPVVLGNAMPKSGSHLIIQVLQGLVGLGPFVNPGFPPLNRSEANDKLPDQEVMANIERMLPGDIAYGYIQARQPFTSLLTNPGRATIFVYRDPRDMVISHIFYATQMHPGHGMHRYYTRELQTMEQRIEAAIRGVEQPGSELSPVREKYEKYMGWLEQPDVLCLRFEDLILKRELALGQLLDYLIQRGLDLRLDLAQAISTLSGAISPRRSGTYRKSQPGNWREHFSEENKVQFKETNGDLLVRLGYEKDFNW